MHQGADAPSRCSQGGVAKGIEKLSIPQAPVMDKAFGNEVEEEYTRLMTDRKDRAYFSRDQYNRCEQSNSEPFLASGGHNPNAPSPKKGASALQMLSSLTSLFKEKENQGKQQQSYQKKQKSWASKGHQKPEDGWKRKDNNRSRYYRD